MAASPGIGAVTAMAVYYVYYPRLLGLLTVESVLFCFEKFVWILRLPLYLILSDEGWGWCPVNTVCAVCVCILFIILFIVFLQCVCVVCWLRLSQGA